MRKLIILLILTVLWSSSLIGGGYQVRLQGQKQTSIGLIGTPFNYGASSIFYNPGSLALYDKKWSIEAGVSGVLSNVTFQKAETDYQANTDNPASTPFYAYLSYKIKNTIAVGVGVYTPYGSSAKWDKDWAGRYLIQDIRLKAIFIQPTVAYQYKEKFGIGAGFVYVTGDFELNKALSYNDNSTVHMTGKGSNIGFNVGVFFRPIEKLNIGVDYRSKILMKVNSADASFTVPSALSGMIPSENKFKTELPLPANLDFGLSYEFNDHFLLALEMNWIQWSAYESLDFTFEQNGEVLDSSNPREYKDSWIPRIGAQYTLNEKFAFRAGIYYDNAPTNEDYFSPETVSLNTVAFTLGASIKPLDWLSIDLSYLQLFGKESDMSYKPDNFSGTYKTMTACPGIGISLQF